MYTIRNELNIRKQEITNHIDFIKLMEQQDIFDKETSVSEIDLVSLRTSIKASIIVMIYNAIESMMTKCLNNIHTIIEGETLCYDELNTNLKKIVLIYYHNAINNSSDSHKVAEFQRDQIEFVKGRKQFDFSYECLSKYYPMYSGNLDAKQIRKILNRYGIDCEVVEPSLKTVKDYRNALAHGEKSFEEVGRELTYQQIEALFNNSFKCMNKVLDQISDYINNKKYTT